MDRRRPASVPTSRLRRRTGGATAWSEACASVWLGERGRSRCRWQFGGSLEALGEPEPALTTKASLARRITAMQRDQKQFADEVAALAGQLGLTAKDPSATAMEIVDRVKAAETAQTLRAEADGARRRPGSGSRGLEEANVIQEEAKGKMTALFGVSTLEEVDAKLSELARRAELQEQLGQVEFEILDALRFKTIAEAEDALEAMDRNALEREQIDLKGRFENEDTCCQELFCAATLLTPSTRSAATPPGGPDRGNAVALC